MGFIVRLHDYVHGAEAFLFCDGWIKPIFDATDCLFKRKLTMLYINFYLDAYK